MDFHSAVFYGRGFSENGLNDCIMTDLPTSVDATETLLRSGSYLANQSLTALFSP